ncbi:MAG: sensor histidine kinase [Burkholderiaceae bacterium]
MSLRSKLLKWLVIPLLAVNLAGAAAAYWLAWMPAQAALDQSLADAAWALVPHVQETDSLVELRLSQQAEQVLRVDHFDEVYFVVRDLNGRNIAGDHDFPPLRSPEKANTSLPYGDVMRGQDVRVVSLKTIVGGETILIGAAETRIKRLQIRLRIFLSLVALEVLLALLIPAVVWLALNKGLLPLRTMQANLEQRKPDDLSELPVINAPLEIVPFIRAINDLLERVQDSSRAKQDFLANVAHQLRTPLAGFKAQLEWLQAHHRDDPDTARSAALMVASTERMARKANQLLALARSEPGDFERERLESLSLDALVAESVQHFVEEALKKNIDIGFDLQTTIVSGDRFLLRDLIDNLVDNAIRYSPEGSAVTVSCTMRDGAGVLTVEDAGPGIPESEKERVFNRFYRIDQNQSGSGLGLPIVRDIAKDHHAVISVKPGADGKGTRFSVLFPAISMTEPHTAAD